MHEEADIITTSFRIDKYVLEHVRQISRLENRTVSNVLQTLIEDGTGLTQLQKYETNKRAAQNIRAAGVQILENSKQSPTRASQEES